MATKLWEVGMSIFVKVSGDCGCTVFEEGPLAVPLAFGESACKDRRTGARLSAKVQLAGEMQTRIFLNWETCIDWNML